MKIILVVLLSLSACAHQDGLRLKMGSTPEARVCQKECKSQYDVCDEMGQDGCEPAMRTCISRCPGSCLAYENTSQCLSAADAGAIDPKPANSRIK